MPTTEKCKKILEQNNDKYTKEQIESIKKLLYVLADIEFAHYQLTNDEKESSPLH